MDDVVIRLVDVTVEIPLRGVRPSSLTSDTRIVRDERGRWILRALDKVNLVIRRGEKVGLSGSNGAGKSTLLKLIAGMLPAAAGTVEVDGSLRALLAIGAGFFPSLSGRQNALIQYGLLGINQISQDDFLTDVENFAELGDFFQMPVGAYSPGMISRLQFAVNTVDAADILLLDEWIGVTDRRFHERAESRLHNYVYKNEAFIFASHDQQLRDRLTDRSVHVEAGKIMEI